MLIIRYYLYTTSSHGAMATNESWLKLNKNYRITINKDDNNQQHMTRTSALTFPNLIRNVENAAILILKIRMRNQVTDILIALLLLHFEKIYKNLKEC